MLNELVNEWPDWRSVVITIPQLHPGVDNVQQLHQGFRRWDGRHLSG